MRSLTSFFAVVGMVLGLGLAESIASYGDEKPDAEGKAPIPTLTDDEAKAIVRIVGELNKETKVDVIETPLDDLLRDISKDHEMNIAIDPAGFRRAGVAPDKLITINVKGTSLRAFLPMMLKPLGLTYRVRPDGLWITAIPPPAKKAAEK